MMSATKSPFLINSDEDGVCVLMESEDQPIFRIALEDVDQFCETVYWARKSVMESRNAAELARETQISRSTLQNSDASIEPT